MFLTDSLVKENPYEYGDAEKEQNGSFYNALTEELCFHYDNNRLYRSFCENKGFNPHEFNSGIEKIPPVQVSVFKELGNELSSVPQKDIKLTLQSSATSGIPSSVPVDSVTSKRQMRAMIRVIGNFIGDERKPFLIMDVDPMSGFREILGARYAAVGGYLNFASEAGYFLKVTESNTYYFDTEGISDFIENIGNQSAVVFGFTYILYSEVIQPLIGKGIRFHLPRGSKVIHIGGWKKLESEKVGKDQFNELASELFGVGVQDIIDIYGFTEQMGLNYPDCPCGCKHAPLYSQVIVRDVVTKKVLPAYKKGLLEFVSPIPHSYPGNVVLTDDIGMIVDGECQYHRAGTRFKVLGRLKKAEIRGCGDILSSKLKFADSEAGTAQDTEKKRAAINVYYNDVINIEGMSGEKVIEILAWKLEKQLSWLRKQPIDALIALICKIAEKWRLQEETLGETQGQGLKFLVSWCSTDNLVRIANEGLRGNRHYADTYITVDDTGIRYMKSISRGLVCHWLAGNVQVLGMFVLLQSLLSKNVNLLRVSGRDNGVFEMLLKAFEGESYTTPGGYVIKGDDVLKTIAVVAFDHNDKKTGRKMSLIADARVAWGGNEAVSTIAAFPSKYNCEDIILGPKLSFSVVAKEAIDNDRKAKKLARKIAVDASVFDQTGCASAHNVFVEKGAGIAPAEFARYLAVGMDKISKQLPKGRMTSEEFAAVHSARGIYDFKGTVYGDEESIWTVLYSERAELSPPCYSRVLFVHSVNDLDEVIAFVTEDIQTIGLAADGEKAIRFASSAAEKGASRFPVCGKMLNFECPWDGVFIMDRLVRWSTLGGPLI